MKVIKFGGSSISSAENITKVIKIIESDLRKGRCTLIFSAFQGITNLLFKAADLAKSQNQEYLKVIKDIEERHLLVAKTLISEKNVDVTINFIHERLKELYDIHHGVFLVKECTLKIMDYIASFGERLSTYIISEVIKAEGYEVNYLDAREVIKTNNAFGSAQVDFAATNNLITSYFKNNNGIKIATGYIASTTDGETTTLGRNGSDYTGAIFAGALNAESLEIWTDTSGIMTADPRLVYKAFTIPQLTYNEAMELSHFGAKVLFPASMQPVMKQGIPVYIKNTFAPEHTGSLVSSKSQSSGLIKGISSLTDICLINIQGTALMEVVGMSRRFFGALADSQVNIILISQASSEHSICIAISGKDAERAVKAIEIEFANEISAGSMDPVMVKQNMAVVSIVGENMRQHPGSSGRMFQALGRNNVNVFAIAQGSSELNISAVVSNDDHQKALNALHEAFFLSEFKVLHMFLIGKGLIGSALLKMIGEQLNKLKVEQNLEIQIHGIANSRWMLFHEDGFNLYNELTLNNSSEEYQLNKFLRRMFEMNFSNSVLVDCTSSEEVAESYESILEANISIVTPNKKANSGSYERFEKLHNIALKRGCRFLYETNVAAGLPVISTLQDLVLSGDKIRKIEGVLSGSVNFIFSNFEAGKLFSNIVKQAKEKGYTEPDPRDDLSGLDVARKILILARVAGVKLHLEDISINSLVPKEAESASTYEEFMSILSAHDNSFTSLLSEATIKNEKLRFVASLEDGHANVKLKTVDSAHPFYSLKGSDNMILFTTERYNEFPMVIRGPGAGAEVTAAGVFADIIRVGNYLR
jgi:aspartokinase/homoserine dehydrogenase 1